MSKFARRHYEEIAKLCQEIREFNSSFITEEIRNTYQSEIEQRLGDLFIDDNSQFNRARFEHACRPGSNVKAKTAHLKVA